MTCMVIRKAKLADFSQFEISEYVFCVCPVKTILLREFLNNKSGSEMVVPALTTELRQLSLVWKTELGGNMSTQLSSETAVEAPSKIQ